jgi:C-terminal processing protease CtpA/Prc
MSLPGKSLATRKLLTSGIFTFLLAAPVTIARAQKVESTDRDRGQVMLSRIKDNLKKNYYDASFHGMDVEARFKTASDKIKEAQSVGQIMGIIAQVLMDLDDSHTFFMPPSRAVETDYGWTMMMIGDRCYVSSVDKGSDAEAKGVKPGDEVLQAGGHQIDRSNLWKFQYLFNLLRPQPGIRVTLRRPQGEPRQLDLMAKQKQGKKVVNLTNQNEYLELVRRGWREAELDRDRFVSFGDQLLIWKMNEFDLTDSQIDDAFSRAKKYKALILDLRGNGGGWETTITRIVSNLFDHDIKIGDDKSRKQSKPLIAKSRGEKVFTGKLTILVDSRSASASEILARTIQLEKRGNIIGDQTAGAVMAARHYPDEIGLEFAVFYSVSVTVSDLIMSDGNSLEHRGVTPDEIRLPAAEDLAAGRDVVLSYAASLAGVTLDPVEAGKLFPIVVKIKP